VLLAGNAGENGQRTHPALRALLGTDSLQGAHDRLGGEVLLGHRPATALPALADEGHRVAEQPVEDLGTSALRQGMLQRPGRQLVVAVGEQRREQVRRERAGRDRAGPATRIDGRKLRKRVLHRG
jgi:hypothetical protein